MKGNTFCESPSDQSFLNPLTQITHENHGATIDNTKPKTKENLKSFDTENSTLDNVLS